MSLECSQEAQFQSSPTIALNEWITFKGGGPHLNNFTTPPSSNPHFRSLITLVH